MILPIKTDSPLRSTPWANWLLIAANILVYIAEGVLPPGTFSSWVLNAGNPRLHEFVSYAFMHSGSAHLVGNMLFLYIFGQNICDRLGNWGYLAFYLSGAVFAGVGYSLFGDARLVGASGAIAAVTGAYLALLPRSHVTVIYWFIFIGTYEVPSLWFILFYFVMDVFLNFTGDTGNVAHMAHIAGSMVGFLVCMGLLKLRFLPRDHFDMLSLLDRWNRRRQYQAVVSNGYDPFGYLPGGNRTPSAPVLNEVDRIQEARAAVAEEIARGRMLEAAKLYQDLLRLDATQTLSRASQLDIANELYSQAMYAAAAVAYELFLHSYAHSDQAGQVHLMLGLVYGRYLKQTDKARESLLEAVRLLHNDRELELAKTELLRIEGIGA